MPARRSISPALTAFLSGRLVAGPRIEDAVRVAGELAADGRLVALDHVPGPADDAFAELSTLIGEVHAAGLADTCELTLPPALDPGSARRLADLATAAGLAVADGPELPDATVVVSSGEPAAQERCRALAGRRVRLHESRGRVADLAFVRCLNVLLAGAGHPEVAASDPTLIAIAGERAAWNGRAPDSWEYVMPYGVLTDTQHRLVAGGYAVRVAVPSGRGAGAALARRIGGRS